MESMLKKLVILIVGMLALAAAIIFGNDESMRDTIAVDDVKSPRVNGVKQSNESSDSFSIAGKVDVEPSDAADEVEMDYLVEISKPVTMFDAPFIARLKDLEVRFNDGHAESGYIIGINLKYCLDAPKDEEELELELSNSNSIYDYGKDGGEQSEELNKFNNQIYSKYEYCKGISREKSYEFYRYILSSAKDGYLFSLMEAANTPPEYYVSGFAELDVEEQERLTTDYLKNREVFLYDAVLNGSMPSLYLLMEYSKNGEGMKEDPAFAYALSLVGAELADSNGFSALMESMSADFLKLLGSEEVDRAELLKKELVFKIKRGGKIYYGE